MATRGVIHWLLLGPTSVKYLYLKSGDFEFADYVNGTGYTGVSTRWDQNSSSAIPWNSASNISNLTKVFILSDLDVIDCAEWFNGKAKLVEVGGWDNNGDYPVYDSGDQINYSNSYKNMFKGCSLLERVLFRIGDGSNVTDMSYMFSGCVKLSNLHIFYPCSSTVSAIVAAADGLDEDITFDKRYITTISNIFYNCKLLTDTCLYFDLNSVNKCKSLLDLSYALYGCTGLDYLTSFVMTFLSGAESIKNMSYLFYQCTNLTENSYISENSYFTTPNVTNMSYMFYGCTGLKGLDLTSFDTSHVETMVSMFQGCTNLIGLDLGSFSINSLKNTTNMFNGCSKLQKIFLPSNADWNSSALLTTSSTMFTGCSQLVGGNGTVYDSSKVTKTYARIDVSGNKGYFTRSARTVTSQVVAGNGTVTGTGTYDFGTYPTVAITPSSGYYLHDVYIDYGGRYDDDESHSAVTKYYTINLKDYAPEIVNDHGIIANPEPVEVRANFYVRNTYTLSVSQIGTSYNIQGVGDYKYLDTPILVVDMNEGAISFLGWYENDRLVSTQNPYSFTMPDNGYSLIARFGDPPFTNEKVRQFVLTNSSNETYKLTSKDSMVFLNRPNGLGYKKTLSTIRYGNSEDVERSQFEMPQPKGSLYFHASDLNEVYKDYNEFIRFSMRRPFILWYKIPVIEDDESLFATYHLPVEISSIEKSESNELGALESAIEFYGTGFWKHTEIIPDDITKILNDGDLDAGFEITAQKSDSTQFTNPVITLSSGGVVYGKCALEGTFTKIYINTKDKEQKISLWNGSETELDDPFTYIDFDASDGISTFPYPKLKNGKITSISFSYDGMALGANNNVLVVYDKEYVSV